MFSGSFNLATIWSAEVDGLAMQGGAGGQAHWLQTLFLDRSRDVGA